MRFTLFTVVFLGLVLASLPPALARSQKHNSHRDIVEEDYDEGLHMPVRRVDPYIRRDNDPLAQIAAQVSHMASKYRHNFQAFADSHNGKKNPVMNVSIPTDAILEGVAGTTMELGLGSKHKAERRATSGTSSLAPVSAYSFWKGSLNIGTPAQEVEVLWDTGSADFVLNTNQYDDSKSSSAKDTNRWFSIGYADGTGVEGSIFNETVSVVGKEGRHQAIGVPATSTFPSSDPAVVGLAWQAVSVFKRRPFVQTLSAQGSIPRAMFGVALARDSSAAEIRIGGYNPKKLASGAKLNWNTINPSSGFWVTKADQVVLSRTNSQGTKTSKLTNRSLILDTGTSLIYAPTADVKALYEALDIRIVDTGDFITGVFRKDPSFSMSIGGNTWPLKTESLTAYTDSTGLKYGTIVGSDDIGLASGQWLVGDPFFSSVYTVFDMDRTRIAFATPNF